MVSFSRICNSIDYTVFSNLSTAKNEVDVTDAAACISIKRYLYTNGPFMPIGHIRNKVSQAKPETHQNRIF